MSVVTGLAARSGRVHGAGRLLAWLSCGLPAHLGPVRAVLRRERGSGPGSGDCCPVLCGCRRGRRRAVAGVLPPGCGLPVRCGRDGPVRVAGRAREDPGARGLHGGVRGVCGVAGGTRAGRGDRARQDRDAAPVLGVPGRVGGAGDGGAERHGRVRLCPLAGADGRFQPCWPVVLPARVSAVRGPRARRRSCPGRHVPGDRHRQGRGSAVGLPAGRGCRGVGRGRQPVRVAVCGTGR